MHEHAICVEAVDKHFGRNHVLRDLSFNVAPGTTFALLGRNGTGKTTTIRLLLGMIKQDAGAVRVLGIDPQREPIKLRASVGYLAEDQAMYGWMRAEEIISFVAPFYPTWDHDLAQRYAEQFDVPLKTKIKHLSKGESVRLGLLLALAHRPRLVILDDPALGLDPVMRRQFNQDLVAHLQGEGQTVFYSSHLLHEVEPVADEVAILHNGRIVRQGSPELLRQRVKQLVLAPEVYANVADSLNVLSVRRVGEDVAVAVDEAVAAMALLERSGVEHRVVDLNLDEIFEAYVAGNRRLDDTATNAAPIPVAEAPPA